MVFLPIFSLPPFHSLLLFFTVGAIDNDMPSRPEQLYSVKPSEILACDEKKLTD